MIRRHRLPAWRLHAVRGKPARVCLFTPRVDTASCATGCGLASPLRHQLQWAYRPECRVALYFVERARVVTKRTATTPFDSTP